MKKYFLLAFTLGILIINSCTKDKASVYIPPTCGGVSQASITYTFKIAPILNTYCTTPNSICHDHVTQYYGIDMSTYAGAVDGFQNHMGLCAVEHSGPCGQGNWMPYALPQLPDSLITSIQCWANFNYPQ
jgi:hypothetical protein